MQPAMASEATSPVGDKTETPMGDIDSEDDLRGDKGTPPPPIGPHERVDCAVVWQSARRKAAALCLKKRKQASVMAEVHSSSRAAESDSAQQIPQRPPAESDPTVRGGPVGMTVRYPDGILKFYPLPCQSLCHVCRTRVGKYTCVACGVGPLCNLHCTGISASFPRIRRGKKPWAPFEHVYFGCRN